ncbi:MAG TPA: TonB-dependent receptor, partial [Cyclobacteriaceae bacterium]|nr:TonB-dependent receptor [Cyclobacteriaceae bacterium]
ILDKKVSLRAHEMDLKGLLAEIEAQTNVKFTYRSRVIRDYHRITINTTQMKLGELLDVVLDPSIEYEVVGKQIVLKSNPSIEVTSAEVTSSIPNQMQVTGTVKDDTGSPMPGVNVLVKGTNNGTSTDTNGSYSIQIDDENSVLVFSFIGYTTQEITVGKQTTIDVNLVADVKALQEVVVVGYGEQKKITVTGAVVSVAGSDLQRSPAIDLSNSLAGRMAGVSAIQASGEPGYDQSTIRIRGGGTLTAAGSNALVVVDGIPDRDGGLNRISPQDIETMSVLKDASAAIYGARAANGVILVTTKHGKVGPPQITYDLNQGWSQPTVIPKMSNASEYAAIMNEIPMYKKIPAGEWSNAWASIQQTGSYTSPTSGIGTINSQFSPTDVQKYKDGSDPWGHPNTDWFGTAFKKWAPQVRHNLQISGGTEAVKYLASIGYLSQDGIYKNTATKYKQYNFRINLDARINKYINTSLGIMAREEVRNFPTQSSSAIFRMLMRGRPTDPEVWPNGLPGPAIENGQNPIVITTNATGYDRNPTDYLQSNGKVEITNPWIENLKLTLMGSADKKVNNDKKWETPWYLYTWNKTDYEADGVTPKLVKALSSTFTDPRLTMSNENALNTNLTALLSYDHSFNNGHTVGVMAGATRETFKDDNFFAFGRNYISTAVDQLFARGSELQNTGGSGFKRTRLGNYGRFTYNYKEKYLAEFIWRYDGSYNFPSSSRFGFFPGILVGYNISNEEFFQNHVSFINFLKIRGSYGQMGNDQIYFNKNGTDVLQEYGYLQTYGFGQYPVNSQVATTLTETVVANPNFTWERANNLNIGLDGTLLGGKLDFTFEYFDNRRNNILIQKTGSTPASSGISTILPPVNAGKVNNTGFDYNVRYKGEAGALKFQIGVNGGYVQNKVVFMDEIPGAPKYQKQTGKQYGGFLVYKSDGAFKNQAEIDEQTLDYSAVTSQLLPGDMKFKDINHDGKIDANDKIRLDKTINPKFNFGITMNFQYRNFDLAILFQGAMGALLPFGTESGDIGNYLKYSYDNRWSIDHPSGTNPRLASRGDTYYTGGNFGNNTYFLFNKNYIRLKNLELGYSIPEALASKVGLSKVRIYVNGLNLLTLDKYRGKLFDPESTSGSGQYYPQARVINTGLRLTF